LKTARVLFSNYQYRSLLGSCEIPPGQDKQAEGIYFFDTSAPAHDNCVSWVGKRINRFRPGTIDIPCPARIRDMYKTWKIGIHN
jgi:hypothetical protein